MGCAAHLSHHALTAGASADAASRVPAHCTARPSAARDGPGLQLYRRAHPVSRSKAQGSSPEATSLHATAAGGGGREGGGQQQQQQ